MSGRYPAWLRAFARLSEQRQRALWRRAPEGIRTAFSQHWPWQAHDGQVAPAGEWSRWLILAGRGFGKTRAGAEWVHAKARRCPGARIALIGGSRGEAAGVMVEGESGLLACGREEDGLRWWPSRGELRYANGARGIVYSGERPDALRGPQFHFAWCDELAKWKRHRDSYMNLSMGLRLGTRPRMVITTTPRPISLIGTLIGDPETVQTGGPTAANRHLPESFRAHVERTYGGTRLGRQELEGVYLEEAEGALWTRAGIEAARRPAPERGALARVVIGVDPPASEEGDACGIIVAGIDAAGTGWVLEDASAAGLSPQGWGRRVCEAAARWSADCVIAESNQGGNMVGAVLRLADPALPVRLRHALEAKGRRAEPVSHLFEQGRVRLTQRFDGLEDELVGMLPGSGYAGPGRSPDRADAMVWALGELMLGRSAGPELRSF